MATERLRAVFDTNVIIAALKSPNPNSPTAELLQRWSAGEFDLIYSAALRDEYEEMIAARGVDQARAKAFLVQLDSHGIRLEIAAVEQVIEADPDDDLVLACATQSEATHLVTYDPHFAVLGASYRNIKVVTGLHFLYLVRGDSPPLA